MGAVQQTISYAYGEDANAGWNNILTEYNGEDITYDAIGNPITYRGATLDWDTRELKSYSKNGTEITYKYDADGLRASKTVNGEKTTYQYVSGKLMYEECNGAEKYYFYDSNGVISGIRYFDADGNMTMIYVVTNALGDVIALYDKDGNAVVEYQYDAWGNIVSVTNSTENAELDWNEVNPFRYRGYYWDSETELYYLQSRYYDAEVGRFINADHYVSTGLQVTNFNMFAYCNNNPVIYVDLNGCFPTLNDIIDGIADGAKKVWNLVDENILDPIEEGFNKNIVAPISNLVNETIEFGEDLVATVNFVVKYPNYAKDVASYYVETITEYAHSIELVISFVTNRKDFKVAKATYKICSGVKDVASGMAYLVAPEPTGLSKAIGVAKIVAGSIKIATYTARIIKALKE